MWRRIVRISVICLLLLVAGPEALAQGLKAGVAKVDVTPPAGVKMWGYGNRKGPATGTLDPLYARVLVLEAGGKRLALVTLDFGRPFGPSSLARLRQAAEQTSHINYVLVAASHTHSGPVIQDEYTDGPPAWEVSALNRITEAIAEASRNLTGARIGTGHGVAYIGHNRLRVNPDGTVSWFEKNPTMAPTAPVDPTVSVLRVDTEEGKPLAVLVNYSCHPVVFGPDNLQYSADYPGVMTRTVEQAVGGGVLCFFLQGAPGDINPYYAVTPLVEGAVMRRDWTGEQLGNEAARVAQAIHTADDPNPSLDFAEDTLTFHLRWDPEKFRLGLIAMFGPRVLQEYGARIQNEMRLPVAAVLINKRIAFMTMPGEPFVNFQMDWRNRCPVRDAFFLGYANGYYGYFPTIRMASLGGYGAGSATTWVDVGAGEQMVTRALVMTYQLLGKLDDTPEDLKKK
jgi:Neutral/alkaline non-lysosomal ceramidase, N-terminal